MKVSLANWANAKINASILRAKSFIQTECETVNPMQSSVASLLDAYKSQLHELGIPTYKSSLSSELFEQRNLADKAGVINQLSMSLQDLQSAVGTKELSLETEVRVLKSFLNRSGLIPVTDRVYDNIFENDIIEVYNHKGVQIYRSWSYFRFCRYSISDLILANWSELWVRPKFVVDRLQRLAPMLFEPECSLISYSDYNIKPYVVRERYKSVNQDLLFTMKHACPLICQEAQKPMGFVTTGSLEFLPVKSANQSEVAIL